MGGLDHALSRVGHAQMLAVALCGFSRLFAYVRQHGQASTDEALVEPRGIEPLTSAVRLQRSPI